jgi:hypothetical protein
MNFQLLGVVGFVLGGSVAVENYVITWHDLTMIKTLAFVTSS